MLLNLCFPCTMKVLPKAPPTRDERIEQAGVCRLNLSLAMLLTLACCHDLNSFRFLNGLMSFNHGHLSMLSNFCELAMLEEHLKRKFMRMLL